MDKPILMEWQKPSRTLPPLEGAYDGENQRWMGDNISMSSTTWSRTSTTGIFGTDPDEDRDD